MVNGVRKNYNNNTAWIDGSQVYGSDDQIIKQLRTFVHGKMGVDSNNLLPRVGPYKIFLLGDKRGNENVLLTTFHTIFVREHNRICDEVLALNSSLTD
jgi:peroxidase